jgi:hypothetical protein
MALILLIFVISWYQTNNSNTCSNIIFVVSKHTRSKRTYLICIHILKVPSLFWNKLYTTVLKFIVQQMSTPDTRFTSTLLLRCHQWKDGLHSACTDAACMQMQSARTDVTHTTPTTTNRLDMMNGRTEIDQLKWTALIPGRSAISAPKLCVSWRLTSWSCVHACKIELCLINA